jgi:hypothetical protein
MIFSKYSELERGNSFFNPNNQTYLNHKRQFSIEQLQGMGNSFETFDQMNKTNSHSAGDDKKKIEIIVSSNEEELKSSPVKNKKSTLQIFNHDIFNKKKDK